MPSVDQFDAIVFHYPEFDGRDLPSKRSQKQRYVFWSIEAPQWYPARNQLNGFFNTTMTFQDNSDVDRAYSHIIKVKEHPTAGKQLAEHIKTFGSNNKHLAGDREDLSLSWLVSSCTSRSNRDALVNEMKKHLNISIYGRCGTMTCTRKDDKGCLKQLEMSHKFYLAFENALCPGYVTEKFFKILDYNMIPIVFGGANYTKLAPPHSFIDVLDFETVKDLADYLKVLHSDDAKYAEYFWWRDYYEVRRGRPHGAQSFCDLCKLLNDPKAPAKIYSNLASYWGSCKSMRLDKGGRINLST